MVSLDLQDAYLQVPIHHDSRRSLRFVVGGRTYQFRVLCFGLTTSHRVFMRIMAPISAILHKYVTIDSSWPIQNSSLVYLGMEIRSLPFMARPPPVRVRNLLRLLEEFLSTPSPPASLWHCIVGHLSSLTFLVPDGMLRMRLLQPCLKDQWDFLDDQFQVSWSPLCREFLLWWTRVAQLREGVSFSLPVPDVSFLSDASDVCWGPS